MLRGSVQRGMFINFQFAKLLLRAYCYVMIRVIKGRLYKDFITQNMILNLHQGKYLCLEKIKNYENQNLKKKDWNLTI